MARHGFRGDGAHGQFCIVVPEADLVVATTARVDDMQAILDVLWERLLPALDPGPADDEEAASARLAARLEALALPVVEAGHDGPDGPRRFVVEERGADQPLAPGTELTVTRDGADHLLSLRLPSAELAVVCGHDRWTEGLLGQASGVSRGLAGSASGRPDAGGLPRRLDRSGHLRGRPRAHRDPASDPYARATVLGSRRGGTHRPCAAPPSRPTCPW